MPPQLGQQLVEIVDVAAGVGVEEHEVDRALQVGDPRVRVTLDDGDDIR